MNFNIQELEDLKAEYLLTLDDDNDNEWYCTPRNLALGEIDGFFDWLKNRKSYYFIVDDVIGPGSKEGFEVMFGNPWTAVGVVRFQSDTRRACEFYIDKHITKGEEVYRVFLARRHGEHRVVRIK